MHGILIHRFRPSLSVVFAALLLVVDLAAEGGARAADADAPPRDDEVATIMKPEARALYDKGLAFYQSKDYPDAIAAFEAGFALEPRREFLFANAQARRLAGDCRGAVPIFQRFLEMTPSPVQASATHIALARCAQQMAAEKPVTLPPLAVPPVPPPPPPPPPWTHDRWGAVLLGAGVVGLAVGGGFLAASFAALPSADASMYAQYGPAQATAESRHTIAVIGLVGGGALAAAGVARYAWVRHERRAHATLTLVPGGLALEGAF
jgi:tetratricopeptide (TPR) repeat protein